MATPFIRRERNQAAQRSPANGVSPPRKYRRRRLMIVSAVLLVIVWLLPGIVVHTPLLNWILGKATANLNGSVTVGSASLGWFSPIAVENVEIKDAKGKSILALPAACGDRPLAAILCNYSNLGQFTLDHPKLSIVLREDGSNVEDLLAKYLAAPPSSSQSSTKIGLAIKINDASISVSEEPLGLGWRIETLNVSVDMRDGTDGPLKAELAADLPDAHHPGKLKASATMASGAGKAELSVQQIPLAMFQPLLCACRRERNCPGSSRPISARRGAAQTPRTAGKPTSALTASRSARRCSRATWCSSTTSTPAARSRGRPTRWISKRLPSIATWAMFRSQAPCNWAERTPSRQHRCSTSSTQSTAGSTWRG